MVALKLVSIEPSGFTRPMQFSGIPPKLLKLPPTKILPSACTAKQCMLELALTLGFQESGTVVLMVNVATVLVVTPKLLLMTTSYLPWLVHCGLLQLMAMLVAPAIGRPFIRQT